MEFSGLRIATPFYRNERIRFYPKLKFLHLPDRVKGIFGFQREEILGKKKPNGSLKER
ncbi:hypothetical protein LEP1GSC047_3816 [Leptospira inadai serovar Lyme str. 10]|uniref:Uncharacterized protein n=1 Tax=Leptospira inadai serovar Lyme str. 10 TaxID=1049790 RepID=V6HDV3_9LEPT|nr:hypothetical protein LEP1GSC047_3816 [Leptospira inadai serovar Lyme str. 10]